MNIQKLVFKVEYQTCLNVNSGWANFTRIMGAGQEYCDKTKAEIIHRNTSVFQRAGELSLIGRDSEHLQSKTGCTLELYY